MGSAITLMDGAGRYSFQPPFVSDYPPARDNLPPSLTMSWDLQGNDAGDFTITSTVNGTANLYFAASPNFEGPADTGANNVYDVTVRVRDNGSPRLQDTQGVAITVQDVNETPVVSGDNSPAFAEIEYDVLDADLTAANYIIATYSATDDDNSDNANLQTITWDVSGDRRGALHHRQRRPASCRSASVRTSKTPSNMGSNNTYEIVVEAEDDNAQGESKTGSKSGHLTPLTVIRHQR